MSIRQPDGPAHRLAAAITRDQVRRSLGIDISTEQIAPRQHDVPYLGDDGGPSDWDGAGTRGGRMVPMARYSEDAEPPGGAAQREEAMDGAVPAPVLSAALDARFGSRGDAGFANRVPSAMRHESAGDVERSVDRPPAGT